MPLYEIEWGGFLTNHLAHGRWALGALGAPDALVQRYSTLYVSRLTPLPEAEPSPPPPRVPLEAEVLALRGRRREYASQRTFFAQQIAEGGADATLLRWLPELLPGLAGAALHPVIHLAVAVREGDDALLAEGLAYLNHSFLGAATTAGATAGAAAADADADVAVGAARGAGAERHVADALARPPSPPVAASGRFQRALAGLLHDAGSAAALRRAASALGVRGEESMLDAAVRLYVGHGQNDYFLLHAVTASWGLRIVLGSAAGLRLPRQARQAAVQALAVATTAAAWTQGVEQADVAPQEGAVGPREALASAQAAIAALNAEGEPRNEHVYKLVAVAEERLRQLADQQDQQQDGDERARPPPCAVCADWAAAIAMVVTVKDFSGRGTGEKPTAKVDLGDASSTMHQVAA